MLLTTVVIVGAASGLILLVILELMREVVILRGQISALGARLELPSGPTIGQVVELDSRWSPPDDWFVMSLVSSECPACNDLAEAASELIANAPELARRLLLVDGDASQQGDDVGRSSGPPSREMLQRMLAPDLFPILGVTATPTMVLLEGRDDVWIVTDAAVGADREWLQSRLHRDTNTPEAHVVDSVTTTSP